MKRLALFLVSAALVACSAGDEKLSPVTTPAPTTDPQMDAGPDAEPPPAPDAGLPKRTVEQRNPFGNVAETDNLLWDGDFEWTSPFADQYGWLSGPPLDFAFPGVRLGAECRSGIKCVALKKKRQIAGLAVSSKGDKLRASFWAHLKKGACDGVKATIVSFDGNEPDAPIAPAAMDPDAAGWCSYSSVIAPRETKPLFLISNQTGDEIVVDDAVLKRAEGAIPLSVKLSPPTAEDAAEIAAARAQLAALRGPHDSPPNAAQRAFEAWSRR